MSNCAMASIFSAVMAGLLVSLATPKDVANDAVKAENTRLVQEKSDLSMQVKALQDRLADLTTQELNDEKKRAAQCKG